jgi:hypothetical protein
MRTGLSTESATMVEFRWPLEFTNTIEIVAFSAVYGLVVSEQVRKRGISIEKAIKSQEVLLRIMQFSAKECTDAEYLLFKGKLVLENIILGQKKSL